MTCAYDYLFVTLQRSAAPQAALAAHLRAGAAELAAANGEVVGQFSPQLGWAGNEAAVLVRWQGIRPDGDAGLTGGPVKSSRWERLAPTIRPADDAQPAPGGIYVHRWFEVEAAAADEFVDLSGQGWERFEATFDTQIFGLFRAARSEADLAEGVQRLLLITRYGDHGVWEDSRDPTTEAMQIFARRQQLTRRSWAASTRLVAAS
jgi:hypothetical protein